jgi:hypothetical protein
MLIYIYLLIVILSLFFSLFFFGKAFIRSVNIIDKNNPVDIYDYQNIDIYLKENDKIDTYITLASGFLIIFLFLFLGPIIAKVLLYLLTKLGL